MFFVWLEFKFAAQWFNRLGCRVCVKWLFPVFKTAALTGNARTLCCARCGSCCGDEQGINELSGRDNVPAHSPTSSVPVTPADSPSKDGEDDLGSFQLPPTIDTESQRCGKEQRREYNCLSCCCTDQAS